MLFLCSGPHNTSLSNAVKKVTVLNYHPHDVVACDENGHVSSHFQAMGSDVARCFPVVWLVFKIELFFKFSRLCDEMNSLAHFGGWSIIRQHFFVILLAS